MRFIGLVICDSENAFTIHSDISVLTVWQNFPIVKQDVRRNVQEGRL